MNEEFLQRVEPKNINKYNLFQLSTGEILRDQIEIQDLPLLDRWMLHRTAEVNEEITLAFENYEFSRFFQVLQSYCVVDLSNFYLDIAN